MNLYPYADPFAGAQQRAKARVDATTSALQQALNTRLQGYSQARDQYKADADWLLRTGAQANMRNLQARNAVNSGLRNRLAERLQAQVGRPLMRNLQSLTEAEQAAQQSTAEQIAAAKSSLPVWEAEELQRQYSLDAAGLQNALQEATATGRFIPPQAKALISQVMQAKMDWNTASAAKDQAGMDAAHARANQVRDTLRFWGIDPKAIEANVNLEGALSGVNQVGTITPEARQLYVSLYGSDPVTGKTTLPGAQVQQALQRGNVDLQRAQVDLDVAGNPDYGLGAQARTDIAYKQALAAATARSGSDSSSSSKKAGTVEDLPDLMERWGLAPSDVGVSWNYPALDSILNELAGGLMDSSMTEATFDEWVTDHDPLWRRNGVDPGAVRELYMRWRPLVPVGSGSNPKGHVPGPQEG